jgi:hypothetical protein
MSLSATMERIRPESASPFDRVTTVFYPCSADIYSLCAVVRSYEHSFHCMVGNDGMSIPTGRGRSEPDITSPFYSFTIIFYNG